MQAANVRIPRNNNDFAAQQVLHCLIPQALLMAVKGDPIPAVDSSAIGAVLCAPGGNVEWKVELVEWNRPRLGFDTCPVLPSQTAFAFTRPMKGAGGQVSCRRSLLFNLLYAVVVHPRPSL